LLIGPSAPFFPQDVVNHRTTSLQAYENAQKRVSHAHSEKAKSAHDANSRADPRALQAECDAAELDEKDSREGYVSAHVWCSSRDVRRCCGAH
jgi:hypothetical protein